MNDKNYDDIINLPCPTSKRHPRMAMIDRAAQFAPFAALTGYDDAITETGRLTGTKLELSEETKERIDLKINYLIDNIEENPEITVTYFVPDKRKSGGEYLIVTGKLKKIDGYEQTLLMMDGLKISIFEILSIESEIFHSFFD
ncbi:MAG: hypothetical protein J6D23_07335 [Clostridia bacterium]|nr:hypothetical protein [Clostridia bacterium]